MLKIKLNVKFIIIIFIITNINAAQDVTKLILKGESSFQKKHYLTAEKYFKLAIKKEPNNTRALNNLSVTYIKLKNYGSAQRCAEEVTKISKDKKILAAAYYNWALTYEKRKSLAWAIKQYKKSIEYRKNSRIEKKIKELEAILKKSWLFSTHYYSIIFEERFGILLKEILPDIKVGLLEGKKKSLDDIFYSIMSGPKGHNQGNYYVVNDRYVIITSDTDFEPGNEEDVFFWYDTEKEKGIVVFQHSFYNSDVRYRVALYYASNDYKNMDALPKIFNEELLKWCKVENMFLPVETKRFQGPVKGKSK